MMSISPMAKEEYFANVNVTLIDDFIMLKPVIHRYGAVCWTKEVVMKHYRIAIKTDIERNLRDNKGNQREGGNEPHH